MLLNRGSKVVFSGHGPCRLGAVVIKTFAGMKTRFYPLIAMDDSSDVLFVPVEKIKTLRIRRLMEKSEILTLLSRLGWEAEKAMPPASVKNWKQRAVDNSALLGSGSATDLVKLIGSLTELNETKALAARDRHVLDKARKHLICEISEVLGESRSAAEEKLDDALKHAKARLRSPGISPR